VAIVGRPNVGKSSLLNRLVGQKIAITSHKAQTTRHSLLGIRTLDRGQILYVDTPGIHKRGGSVLNRRLNQAAESVIDDVDLLLWLVQANKWTDEDEAVLRALRVRKEGVILVVNKVDLVKPRERLLPFLEHMNPKRVFDEVVPVSVRRDENLDRLEQLVLEHLPEGPKLFPEDQVTDRSERFMAAELLREQLTRRYANELPYALTVEIERFEESDNLYRINAVVWVERPGQKAILIGKDGSAMKETGRMAREAMQSMFGKKVWLEVWVKVKKSWSSDTQALARFGYTD
jgi:GTP-binding protein Era